MREHDKIRMEKYITDLNERVKHARAFYGLKKDYVKPIASCKDLAERCELTPGAIYNLNTSSSFIIIYKVANEILDAYFGLFELEERRERKDDPGCWAIPRDISYVIHIMTDYYTNEWFEDYGR